MIPNILTQPSVLGVALLAMIILQLIIVILLVNISSKLNFTQKAGKGTEKSNSKVDDALKRVSNKLKDAEKKQENIRRNFDETKNRTRRSGAGQSRDQKRPRGGNRPSGPRRQERPKGKPREANATVKREQRAPKQNQAEPVTAEPETVAAVEPNTVEQVHGRRPVIKRRSLEEGEIEARQDDVKLEENSSPDVEVKQEPEKIAEPTSAVESEEEKVKTE